MQYFYTCNWYFSDSSFKKKSLYNLTILVYLLEGHYRKLLSYSLGEDSVLIVLKIFLLIFAFSSNFLIFSSLRTGGNLKDTRCSSHICKYSK